MSLAVVLSALPSRTGVLKLAEAEITDILVVVLDEVVDPGFAA